jgi:hypothetical protein
MKKISILKRPIFGAALSVVLSVGAVVAAPVSIEAVLTPKEQMKFKFADGSKQFILAVRREGKAEVSGIFAGMNVTKFGWHDINPPFGGDPRGYLQLTDDSGNVATIKFQVRAVFMKGEKKPALFDNGYWELVRGAGKFAGKRGVGSLVIKPAGGPKRKFILIGEVNDAP